MKNKEFYKDTIKNFEDDFCREFIMPIILKQDNCSAISCERCHALVSIWLDEEYKEPKVDWSKIEVDTTILVKNSKNDTYKKRYFAKYEDDTIYVFPQGSTSWSFSGKALVEFKYGKLVD